MAVPSLALQNYTEPGPRTISNWTPHGVRSALNLLQGGTFSQAAYLADAILGDDRAQAAFGTRTDGVLGLPLKFTSAGDTAQAQQVAELVDAIWWTIAPEDALNQLLTYGRLLGAAVAELVWQTETGEALPVLKVWHPGLLRHDSVAERWLLRTSTGEITITPGDGKWLLYAPYGERRPWTKAMIRGLAIPWAAKMYAVQDWQRYSERHGAPILSGTTPEGITDAERRDFLEGLQALASESHIVLPAGYDVKLVEAAAKSHEAFEKLIAWADTALTIGILGQNLTTQVEGGSLAAAQVHENIRRDLIRSDAETLATALRQQVLTWWAEFNLGDRELAPWPKWQTESSADRAADAGVYETLSRALPGLLTAGVDITPIAEQYGLTLVGLPEQVRLASRDAPAGARGFIRGQLYTDALIDSIRDRGYYSLRPDLRGLLEIIESTDDYETLRTRLIERYQALEPKALAELIEKALILADLAGRAAVLEDN